MLNFDVQKNATLTETRALTSRKYKAGQDMEVLKLLEKHKLLWSYYSTFP